MLRYDAKTGYGKRRSTKRTCDLVMDADRATVRAISNNLGKRVRWQTTLESQEQHCKLVVE